MPDDDDNGPCGNFVSDGTSGVRCANCGYLRASHR